MEILRNTNFSLHLVPIGCIITIGNYLSYQARGLKPTRKQNNEVSTSLPKQGTWVSRIKIPYVSEWPCSHTTTRKTHLLLTLTIQRHVCELSHFSPVWLFTITWTTARQAPLSMGFSRQEHWSRLPFLSPGDLPHPGIEPRSPALASGFLTTEPPGKHIFHLNFSCTDVQILCL